MGHSAQATSDLHEAQEAAGLITDAAVRQRSMATLGITEARMKRSESNAADIRNLTSSLEYFQRTGSHFALAQVLLERGVAHRLTANPELAKADLEMGITELESIREQGSTEDLRISYFANGQAVFEELMSLLVSESRPIEALNIVERARARELLEEVARPGSGSANSGSPASPPEGPLQAGQITARLPTGVVVIEYAVLNDRLLIWLLRKEGVRFRQVSVSRQRLKESVADFLDALHHPPGKGGAARDGLSRILIDPIAEFLGDDELLVFVPDKSLHEVPFAALRSPDRAQYLIEHHEIAIAPSTTLFLHSATRGRELAGTAEPSILAVGNPSLDPARRSGLGNLPHAEEEASRLARLFAGSTTLEGAAATKARFLTLARLHGFIHFAGHSLVNPRHPQFSSLLFAADAATGDTGDLYAYEVASARLHGTSLVFLSACATAAGPAPAGEGDLSIGRAFLASGVPVVIGSLWPIGDLASERLAFEFYRGISEGRNPGSALRLAQLAMFHGPDPLLTSPDAWAPLELIGGYLPRQPERRSR